MTALPWPPWVSWLLLIAVLVTLYLVWQLARNVGMLKGSLAGTGLIRADGAPFRSREELEDAYKRGSVTVDVYSRWKDRLK